MVHSILHAIKIIDWCAAQCVEDPAPQLHTLQPASSNIDISDDTVSNIDHLNGKLMLRACKEPSIHATLFPNPTIYNRTK